MLIFIILFFLVCQVQPECVQYVQSVSQCDGSPKGIIEATAKEGDGKAKKFDGTIKLSKDVTKETVFELILETWENGAWTFFHTQTGLACENVDQMLEEAWSTILELLDPPAEDRCIIREGEYSVTDLEIGRKDLSFTIEDLEKVRVTLKLLTEFQEEFICGVAIVDIECD